MCARSLVLLCDNAPVRGGPGAAAGSLWQRVLFAQAGPACGRSVTGGVARGFWECILWMGDRRGRSACAYQVSTAVSSHLFLSAYLHEQAMRTVAVCWGFPWVWQQELWLAPQIAEILDMLIVCVQINSVLQASLS